MPKELGIVPESWLCPNHKVSNRVKLPSSIGMLPVNWFSDSIKNFNLDKLPNSLGMELTAFNRVSRGGLAKTPTVVDDSKFKTDTYQAPQSEALHRILGQHNKLATTKLATVETYYSVQAPLCRLRSCVLAHPHCGWQFADC